MTGPPDIRFYAGAPLVTSSGLRLGSLCVIDREPRDLDAEQLNVLCNFAEVVVREIEKDAVRVRAPRSPLCCMVACLTASCEHAPPSNICHAERCDDLLIRAAAWSQKLFSCEPGQLESGLRQCTRCILCHLFLTSAVVSSTLSAEVWSHVGLRF